jgi:hypothetical protein
MGDFYFLKPRFVLGGAGFKPPSEKLNIAFVGIGGQGKENLKACGATPTTPIQIIKYIR